jgi:hypothetical protein
MRPEDVAFIRQESFKMTVSGPGVQASPKHGIQYACVRQIAYELQLTLDNELETYLDKPATSLPPPRTMGAGFSQLKVLHDRNYLEKILADLESRGEGESTHADEMRRLIRWSSN